MSDPQNSQPDSVKHTAQALPDDSSFSSDRYRIERTLGSGGMAHVLLATDSVLDRKVAIKIPQRRSAEESEVLEKRFLREAQAAAGLSHPNICPIYDIGDSDGTFYISMGYIEGCLLSQVIQETDHFEEAEVAQVIRKIASGAAEAHRRGILHRDLKSSNIMIDRRGEPIILDFGLARFFSHSELQQTLTQDGQALGTPAYMSPEQASGNRDLAPASDIFSLGVVMWELLCGERPFQGDTLMLMGQIVHGSAPSPRTKRPDISPQMEAICLKALARDPADRFESMEQFQFALEDVLEGREVAIDLSKFTSDGRAHNTLDLRRTPTPFSSIENDTDPGRDDTAVDRTAVSRIIRHPLFWVWVALGVVFLLLVIIVARGYFGPPPRIEGNSRFDSRRNPRIPPPRPDMTVDDIFSTYDADENGRLNAQEFFLHIIDRADADGDGELDRQEIEDGFQAFGPGLLGPPDGEGEGRPPRGQRPDGRRPRDRMGPPGRGDGFGPGPERRPPGRRRPPPGEPGGRGQRPDGPPPEERDGFEPEPDRPPPRL